VSWIAGAGHRDWGLLADTWSELIENFGRLFRNVAGCPPENEQCRASSRYGM
jgi:hypothetical protein